MKESAFIMQLVNGTHDPRPKTTNSRQVAEPEILIRGYKHHKPILSRVTDNHNPLIHITLNLSIMVTFTLKISATSMIASKTNILSIYKLIHKPSYFTTNRFTKPYSSYGLATTKSYKNAQSASIADEERSMTEFENHALRNGLRAEAMPKHVAMFMDGHWKSIKARDLPPELGYGAGRRSLKEIARICCELGIRVLSVYTNFPRPKEEVDFAIDMTKSDIEELSRNDIRVSIIGNRNAIPDSLLEIITRAEESTKNNKTLHIIEAVNYTGRSDIIQACKALAGKVKDGELHPTAIDENVFQQELETNCSEFPNPDLMIRTGGKQSVGNFMLWQLAYSELSFVDKSAFEFNSTDFIKALQVYQSRHRRFGGNKI
ncbi:hypothetical protein LXL04_036549 [Taraxacum kok-saghyz]